MTPKQERFVAEYLIDLNATQAAIRAGYSSHRAPATGSRLLTNGKVAAAIAARRAKVAAKLDLSQERVLQELAAIGFAKPRATMSWDSENVNFIPSDQLSEEACAAIAGIKSKTRIIPGRTGDDPPVREIELELKFHPKIAALEEIARHLGYHKPTKYAETDANGKPVKRLSETERLARVVAMIDKARERAKATA